MVLERALVTDGEWDERMGCVQVIRAGLMMHTGYCSGAFDVQQDMVCAGSWAAH